jgi:hypothetical protein
MNANYIINCMNELYFVVIIDVLLYVGLIFI